MHFPPVPLAFQMPGFAEMLMLAALGLLLFGKRLPEVGRSLGKGIVEFKKGIRGIEDDIDVSTQNGPQRQFQQQGYQQPQFAQPQPPQQQPVPYRFDPYTGKPIDANAGAVGSVQSQGPAAPAPQAPPQMPPQ